MAAQRHGPSGRRWRVAARRFLTAVRVGVLLGVPLQLAGQEPTLDAVEALVREGDTEDARSLIRAWWAAAGPDVQTDEVQRGLWLRGRLTLDPAEAAEDYRRLVDEYPGGPYSDQALLRLALAAEARDDLETAGRHYRALATDYPSRQTGGDAETWLAVHGSEGRASPTSVVRVEEAPSQPPAHRAEAPVRADEPETAVAAENRPPNSSANGPFTVQIGAYLSAARATRMAERVTEAGFTARIVHVPGSPLFRVRVGRFASSAAATPVADSVGTAGFATYITGNAASERPYR